MVSSPLLGGPLVYPSLQGMPKLSQVSANDSFALASSKQKRVPTSARSIHQSALAPFAMRDASPRSKSNCRPAATTIKQFSLGIMLSIMGNQDDRHGGRSGGTAAASLSKNPGENDLSRIWSQPR